ncbi:MAG: hypothetical protein HY788_03055 [Deltaproteobacteria bacterium]|nr:hypothetical protein [Deltaproteobacteria bacterium]
MNNVRDEIFIYKAMASGLILFVLGLFSVILATLVLFVAKSPWPAFLLMSLPLALVGLTALLNGIAAIGTRIDIMPTGLNAIIPRWRACPLPPFHRFHLGWDEVRAVRHRKEIYHIFLASPSIAPFPVDVYAIETEGRRIVVGGRTIPRLAEAVHLIADRSGLAVVEEKEVEASLIRTLFKGAPGWDSI